MASGGGVAVVTVDLRCMWAKLHMLDWVMGDVVPSLATAQQVTAAMAFVDGECCGQGIRQIHFFARPLEDKEEPDGDGGAEEEDIDDLGEEGEEEDERPQSKWHEDRGRRLDAVQKRAEHFTACSLLALSLTAQEIAQDLVNTWAAFGTFCRTRIGVTPETILRAWQFPVEGDFRETLQRYAPLKPDSEKVKEYTRYICIHWDRQFGRPRDDRHGDGDGDDDGGDDDVG